MSSESDGPLLCWWVAAMVGLSPQSEAVLLSSLSVSAVRDRGDQSATISLSSLLRHRHTSTPPLHHAHHVQPSHYSTSPPATLVYRQHHRHLHTPRPSLTPHALSPSSTSANPHLRPTAIVTQRLHPRRSTARSLAKLPRYHPLLHLLSLIPHLPFLHGQCSACCPSPHSSEEEAFSVHPSFCSAHLPALAAPPV